MPRAAVPRRLWATAERRAPAVVTLSEHHIVALGVDFDDLRNEVAAELVPSGESGAENRAPQRGAQRHGDWSKRGAMPCRKKRRTRRR